MTTSVLPEEMADRFAAARQVADAVLFEGYVLYPYRASAAKNQLRWQFGVLVPPHWDAGSAEHSFQRTECLMEPRSGARLSAELRFLRAQRRTVQRRSPDGGFETVAELALPDRVLVPWDEGVEERVTLTADVSKLTGEGVTVPFTRPARDETEPVHDADGQLVGRLVRHTARIDGRVRLTASDLDGPYAAFRLTATVENTSSWQPDEDGADRAAALPRSLIGSHLLLGLSAGAFVSMTDPPEWAKAAVAACRNEHAWPVLAGESGRADVVLSAPIILEDHPAIAPESPGALYDALEIDEILTLRTAALTDEEKREARGTDPRAAEVIELADTMPPEVLERLHGAVRALREVTGPGPAAPDTLTPDVPGVRPDTLVGPGERSQRRSRPRPDHPRRAVGRHREPGAAAPRPAAHRRPGPLPPGPYRAGRGGPARRRRRGAPRSDRGGRPGRRHPARAGPVPVLPTRRGRSLEDA